MFGALKRWKRRRDIMFGALKRWKRRRDIRLCEHERQMGIYGDLINRVGGHRAYCFLCGEFLPHLPPPECDIDKIVGLIVLSSTESVRIKGGENYWDVVRDLVLS